MERLIEATVLAAVFPGQEAQMRALRRLDSDFDEICSDFVELTNIAAAAERSRDIADIIESLTDLKQEIASALEHAENSNSRKEKQKAKYTYGILEKQFRTLFQKAQSSKGVTGEVLLQLLESRLDNVVFRMGIAKTRAAPSDNGCIDCPVMLYGSIDY